MRSTGQRCSVQSFHTSKSSYRSDGSVACSIAFASVCLKSMIFSMCIERHLLNFEPISVPYESRSRFDLALDWFSHDKKGDIFKSSTRHRYSKGDDQLIDNSMFKKQKKALDVICLSGDEEEDNDDITDVREETPPVTPVKPAESKDNNSNADSSTDPNDASNWIIESKDMLHVSELPSKYPSLYQKPFEIRCSAVRFGIVEFQADCEVIEMHENEFLMRLLGGFQDRLTIKMAYTDMLSFYFSFQSEKPVALIQVRKEFARLFNQRIPTSDDQGKGFDPSSKDVKRQRVLFCLKTLTPDMEKIHTSTIYQYLKSKCPKLDIRCVSGSRAQQLYELTRFARIPVIVKTKKPLILTANDLTPKTVVLNNNNIRFDLSHDDLYGLNEGQFLNDNIIEFYLQYIYYEKLSEEDRKRTYLFNSFFYTRLTKKGKNDNPNVSAAERRYSRVKRWIRDVDIFSKDYLIVPINQTAHWYIILIQFPNEVPTEKDLISDDDDETLDDRLKSQKTNVSERIIQTRSSTNAAKESSKLPINLLDCADEVDEASSDDDFDCELDIDSLIKRRKSSQYPAIVIFDSLRSHSKRRVAATLREFLQIEFDQKKKVSDQSSTRKLFNIDTIPTIDAAVPQQLNYYDCGLYVLQYVENFFAQRSSIVNYQLASTFDNWCEKNSMGSMKRKDILNVINQHRIPKEI